MICGRGRVLRRTDGGTLTKHAKLMCGGGRKGEQMRVAFVFSIPSQTYFTHHVISNAKLSAYGGGSVMVSPVCYPSAIWRVVIRLEPCSRKHPPSPLPLPSTHPPTHPPTSFLPSHPSCNF
jgi:hypothetical protein